MRFAIVESGGKQYRAVEGSTIEVDRLPVEPGKKIDLDRILLVADGGEVLVGTPIVSGVHVKVTVVDHFKGPKIVRFRYRPKKRIRVKGGYRHQYTRLMVDFIGKPGEERRRKEAEAQAEEIEAKQDRGPAKEAEKKPAKKTEKASAASSPKGKKSVSKTSSKSKKTAK